MKITDGTAEFLVRDQRIKAMIDFFFPVGAIYTCVTKPSWMEEYGEWKEVGAGRVLWGADNMHKAGTEIKAGLPNITGTFGGVLRGDVASTSVASGAFTDNESIGSKTSGAKLSNEGFWKKVIFDASQSNPIYGSSDTVQPPAYVVHFYQRIF